MQYIVHSPEAPLGTIEWAWWRKEFQEKQGNPSHIHAILKTTEDISTKEGLHNVLSKIRGSLADILHYEELEEMKQKGITSSTSQLKDILKDAEMYLTHKCHERCQIPKMGEDGEIYFVCKSLNNYLLTDRPQQHTIQQIHVQHSQESLQILSSLGMVDLCSPTLTPTILEPCLKMERHIPRCSLGDGKFSPTNGTLFVQMPSSQNLQFTTGHGICLYLTKYVSEVDEVALVKFRPPLPNNANDSQEMRGDFHSLHNTKISSVNFQARKLKEKTKIHGRPLTQMECLTVIDRIPLVTSTVKFIHMPTASREYRAAVDMNYIRTTCCRPQDMQAVLACTGQTARDSITGFPQCRKFSNFQLSVIKDELLSPLSTDATTLFSMRPPELRFVMEQHKYMKWFEHQSVTPLLDPEKSLEYCMSHLSKDLNKSEWLNGFNSRVVLRRGAIGLLLEYARNTSPVDFGTSSMKREMVAFLRRLWTLHNAFDLGITILRTATITSNEEEYNFLSEHFLSKSKSLSLPIIWHTPIYPRQKNRFLIHLLLIMGKYVTEYELMLSGNIRNAYISARLFNPKKPYQSVKALLSRYVKEFLSNQPGSTFQFDRNLCLADSILNETLCQKTTCIPPTPAVLYSHMQEETNSKVKDFHNNQQTLFVNTLLNDLRTCGLSSILPTPQSLLNSRIIPIHTQSFFPPPITFRQNVSSYTEQTKVNNLAVKEVNNYGKTTVCEMISLYSISKGMNGISTSIVADRAKQLGGIHIHSLCCMNGSSGPPGRIAENALSRLYRNPRMLWLWKNLDFIYFDELGLFNAETFAAVDMIARYTRQTGAFMGGLFCIATMDILQLMPWQGTPLMMSMNMISEFQFTELTQSVRAASDPALREICDLTRTTVWTQSTEDRFRHLVSTHCNFVDSLDHPSIPKDAVYVFGRKAPCEQAEELLLNRIRRSCTQVFLSNSYDEESTTAGNWKQATQPVTKSLSKRLKRRKQLPIFHHGRYEFTYNEPGKFQQGQLAIILDVDPITIQRRENISVWAGPAGCKEYPPLDQCNPTSLLHCGWRKVSVPFATSPVHTVFSGIQARRTQYGLRLRVASTIHASMGSTLHTLVTQVTPYGTTSLDFHLWEASQVVVLLSRTKTAKDIYFVGEANAVVDHLLETLKKTNRYLPYIRKLIQQLGSQQTTASDVVISHPTVFRPCDAILTKESAVYLLVSTKNTSYMYIGETKNLRNRLHQHNTGNGAIPTQHRFLQPWAVFCYVMGFKDRQERTRFEARWKIQGRRRHDLVTPEGKLFICQCIVQEWNTCKREESLIIIRCGSIST
jgi:predicted GIY-YIG superfamily endonuclease